MAKKAESQSIVTYTSGKKACRHLLQQPACLGWADSMDYDHFEGTPCPDPARVATASNWALRRLGVSHVRIAYPPTGAHPGFTFIKEVRWSKWRTADHIHPDDAPARMSWSMTVPAGLGRAHRSAKRQAEAW